MGDKVFIYMLLLGGTIFGQVGINTTSPAATLDINGDIAIRSITEEFNAGIAKDSVLVISADGIVRTIPANDVVNEGIPSLVRGEFSASGGISISLASGTSILPFDTETLDVLNEYDTSTYIFTAKEDGIYQVYVQIEANGSLSVATSFGVSILHNGTRVATANFANIGVLGITVTPPFRNTTTLLQLSAGDTLQFNLDSSLLSASINGNTTNSFFTIQQIR